jgi:hypothetical protein
MENSPDNNDNMETKENNQEPVEMKDIDINMGMTSRKKSMIIKRDDNYIKPSRVEIVTKSIAKYLIPVIICLSAVIGLAIIFIGIFASELRKILAKINFSHQNCSHRK